MAVPLISAGAYGYPKDQVLKFAIQTITEFLFEHELTVYLCVFDKESYSFSQKLFHDIQSFIIDDAPMTDVKPISSNTEFIESLGWGSSLKPLRTANESLKEYVKQMDRSFQEMLFDLIDKSGMTDVECYKKANVDKRTFSKIKSNKNYRPSKQTAVAFAISLQLDLDAAQELLATAGMTLSKSNVFDQIIRYFIQNGIYDVFEINEALFEFDQKLLGAS